MTDSDTTTVRALAYGLLALLDDLDAIKAAADTARDHFDDLATLMGVDLTGTALVLDMTDTQAQWAGLRRDSLRDLDTIIRTTEAVRWRIGQAEP